MRKSREETAASYQRIVAAAAQQFRSKGIAGTGLADLMAAAGMTHGGFYRHFESKDAVVEASLAAGFAGLTGKLATVAAAAPESKRLQTLIASYLSASHRDEPATGCPVAALGGELARESEAVRTAAAEGFEQLIKLIAGQLHGLGPAAAHRKATLMLATMVGALTLSRIVPDRELSDAILRDTRKALVA